MHDLDREGPLPAPRRDLDHPGRGRTPETAPGATQRPAGLDAASILHLQRLAGNAGVVQMLAAEDEDRSPVHDVVGSGGGSPLDAATRSDMESAFGDSFGDVRLHTDAAASQSAESVGANAYTVGSDIVFRSGHGPGSPTFQRDVAHELEHVRQQREGPVDGTDATGGIRLSDPGDRFERSASQRADEIVGGLAAQRSTPAPGGGDGASLQLLEDDAATPVQRVEAGAEEEEEEMPGG
jgi:hypothetical protein